jgi:hypothetical protein
MGIDAVPEHLVLKIER